MCSLCLRSLCIYVYVYIPAKTATNVFKNHLLLGQTFDTRSYNYEHKMHFIQLQCTPTIWKFKYFIVHGGREQGKANRESDRLIYVYTHITYHYINPDDVDSLLFIVNIVFLPQLILFEIFKDGYPFTLNVSLNYSGMFV